MATKSNLLAPLFRGAAIAFALNLSSLGVIYGMEVSLARWLGATQYGAYDYALTIATFLGFLSCLGLPNSLLRFIPEYIVKENWGKLRGIVWGSWRYVLASSAIITTIGFIVLIAWYSKKAQAVPISLALGIGSIPLWALMRHQLEMARGIKRMVLALFPSKVMFPLLILVGAFFYRQNLSTERAIAIAFLSLFLALLWQLWSFARQLPQQCGVREPIYARREWFAVALPLLFNDGALIVLSQTDIIMTGAFLGSFQV